MVLAVGLAAVLGAGCGEGSDAGTPTAPAAIPLQVRPLSLTLAGPEGPESAGMQMAEKRGYFREVGLDVSILTPRSPVSPVEYVVGGTDDLGVAQLPQVVLAKEKGAPIVAIGSLVPEPTAAMIWLKGSQIGGIADLEGKTIGIPGLPFQKDFLERILAREGLTLDDVTVRKSRYDLVEDLVSGRTDAIFGGTWNIEGVELESRGLGPVITRAEDLGLPAYEELVLIARTDFVAEEPDLVRGFMSALARGTAAAIESPEDAAEVIEGKAESNPESSLAETETELELTLPLLSESGEMSPERADELVDWMFEEGLVQQRLPASELLTNDYLGPES